MYKINKLRGNEDVLDKFSITTCGKVFDTKKKKEVEVFDLSGYKRVFLETNTVNKTHVRHVHNLVASAFCGNQPNGILNANHKNGNTDDNIARNISWTKVKKSKEYILVTNIKTVKNAIQNII